MCLFPLSIPWTKWHKYPFTPAYEVLLEFFAINTQMYNSQPWKFHCALPFPGQWWRCLINPGLVPIPGMPLLTLCYPGKQLSTLFIVYYSLTSFQTLRGPFLQTCGNFVSIYMSISCSIYPLQRHKETILKANQQSNVRFQVKFRETVRMECCCILSLPTRAMAVTPTDRAPCFKSLPLPKSQLTTMIQGILRWPELHSCSWLCSCSAGQRRG